MRKFRVKKKCYCEHYLHEAMNYPRKGLEVKILNENNIVEYVEDFNNFYGSYIRVKKDGKTYDIFPSNLEELRD